MLPAPLPRPSPCCIAAAAPSEPRVIFIRLPCRSWRSSSSRRGPPSAPTPRAGLPRAAAPRWSPRAARSAAALGVGRPQWLHSTHSMHRHAQLGARRRCDVMDCWRHAHAAFRASRLAYAGPASSRPCHCRRRAAAGLCSCSSSGSRRRPCRRHQRRRHQRRREAAVHGGGLPPCLCHRRLHAF